MHTLQQRNKWSKSKPSLVKGNIVLISEDNLKPHQWKKGIVEETHPGQDGHVRVVTIRTSSGLIKRPTSKLIILPIDTNYP